MVDTRVDVVKLSTSLAERCAISVIISNKYCPISLHFEKTINNKLSGSTANPNIMQIGRKPLAQRIKLEFKIIFVSACCLDCTSSLDNTQRSTKNPTKSLNPLISPSLSLCFYICPIVDLSWQPNNNTNII